MNSSNSFNICPRCGNSNALNAKYCSRCGGQLKVPEEPVVCHKCHTHNTPMANFCRNCGTPLKVGSETKICPRCGKEVSGDKGICECGYSFVTYQQTIPSTDKAVDVSVLKEDKAAKKEAAKAEKPEKVKKEKVKKEKVKKEKDKKEKVERVYSKKSGRGWAIAGIILILLFAYYIVTPFHIVNQESFEVKATLRPEFLVSLDKGFINYEGAVDSSVYGYDFVAMLVDLAKNVAQGANFGEMIGSVGTGVLMMMALTVVFVVTALLHLVVCITRSVTAKRSKKMNLYFLIMAILSTLLVGLIALFHYVAMPEGFMSKVASWFDITYFPTTSLGLAVWAIPVYFWFFFLYSLCAKAKQLKEKA